MIEQGIGSSRLMLRCVAAWLGMALLLGSPGAGAVSVFTKNVIDSTPDGGANYARAVDIDGDGYTDILAKILTTDDLGFGSLTWYKNDGAGNFTRQISDLGLSIAPMCGSIPCSVLPSVYTLKLSTEGDFNGDGLVDIAAYQSTLSDSQILWWKNAVNTVGDFTPITIESTETGSFTDVISVAGIHSFDIDGDGDLDILAAKQIIHVVTSPPSVSGSGQIDWWRNDGGRFTTKITVDSGSELPTAITSGDLDGDGRQDLIASVISDFTLGAPKLFWYHHNGGSSFTRFTLDNTTGASVLATGDVNGDGRTDVVALPGGASLDAVWYRNDGNGVFSKFPLTGTGGGGMGLKVADLDGDGNQDVLVGNDTGVVWARYEGGGTFTSVPVDEAFTLYPGKDTISVDTADLDGDGTMDVVAAGGATGNGNEDPQPDGLAWWRQQQSSPTVPIVSITASDALATEPGKGVIDDGEFTVTRTGNTTNPLTIYYTMGGTATNGADYTSLPGSVTIPGGQASMTIPLTPIDDNLYEISDVDASGNPLGPGETVIMTLSPDGSYAIDAGSAVVTLADDGDAKPTVNFAGTSSSVLESTTTVNVVVTFDKPAGFVTDFVGYNIGGTATSSDYTSITPDSPVPPNPNNPNTLTFNPGDTSHLIRIKVANDTFAESDESITLTLTDFGAPDFFPYTVGSNNVYTLTILDDEAQRVTVSASDASASEPGTDTGTFTVNRYAGPTTNPLTVNYTLSGTAANGTDYVSLPGSVIVPAGQRMADIVLTPLDDSLIENTETATLTISANAAYRIDAPSSATINLVDDDTTPGVTVTPIGGLVTTEAGGTATFTVGLNSQPVDDVAIGLSSDNTAEGTVYPSSLTFTTADWNMPQTVTVTGVDDAAADGNVAYSIVTAAAVSTDANYSGLGAADVAVTNMDDDTAGITVTPAAGLITDETGATDTFTVVLNTAPTDDVTIGLSSSNINEGTVFPSSLTFTTGNWSTPQTVTVTGVDDAAVDGDVAYSIITAAAASTDGAYSGIDADDVAVTNVDDESPGIKVTPRGGLVTTEAGGTATLDVVLYTAPSDDVIIDLSSSDTTEGTVAPSSLTFTTGDWSTPQTVTVSGVDDAIDDGDVPYTIVTAAAVSTDASYNGKNAADVAATNTDDDTAGITVSPTSGLITTEAGGSATFSVKLNTQPIADVTIGVLSSDATEGAVSPASLVFTSTNWNTARTVTVTGMDDLSDDGDAAYSIVTAPAISSDNAYNGLDASDVSVINTDDDTAGVTVSVTNLRTTESGGTDLFTVTLNTMPAAPVTIGLSSSDTNEGTVTPSSLTFTSTNWNNPQAVVVIGVDDFLDDGDTNYNVVTAAATSGDSNYNGVNAADVAVVNIDDDTAGITISPSSGLVTTEGGGSATFTVVLNSQPTADVTINLSSSDTTEGTVAPPLLTFTSTPGDWNTPRTVTVTGVDDPQQDGNIAYSIVTAAAVSGDAVYSGLNASDVAVINTDDDVAGISVAPTGGLTTTEAGGTATFTVVLDTPPLADVTVGLSSGDITEGTVSPSSLTFTNAAGDWDSPRTVTVTGVNDVMIDGDIGYTIFTAPASSADGFYNGLDADDVAAVNTDDDTVGITVSPFSGLTTTENGDTATFAVVLDAPPSADVTIGLSSSDTDEGTVTPASLTFTTANWSTPRTVTVMGVDDVSIDGNTAYSIITAAAVSADTNYDGIDAYDVAITNIDNDAAGVTVSPAYGLVTTEGGGTATFTVVLNSQPIAGVTIGLSSSDTTEGTVSPAAVTFTNGDWNVPQTVTVTGVDDSEVDGGISYVIVTTAASSVDTHYSGLNVTNVAVINMDDDTPPPEDPSAALGMLWQKSYDNTHFDEVVDATTDAAGNVYVTGRSNNGTNYDFATIKYDSAGTQQWMTPYDGGDSDMPVALNVDAAGNIYVVGKRHNGSEFDYFVVKYDNDGGETWLSTPFASGGEDEPAAMAVDTAGNVYVTGKTCTGSNCDFATVKITAAGATAWSAVYDYVGKDDEAVGVGVDIAGNVYVSGRSSNGTTSDFATVKYNAAGTQLWVARYDDGGNDYPAAVAIDAAGNAYVAGRSSSSPSISDLLIVKYDTGGVKQWELSYNDGLENFIAAMTMDATGHLYITGDRGRVGSYDYGTVKINPNGTLAWSATYDNGGGNDEPADIAVDTLGRVYVTGSSGTAYAGDRNYTTVAYDASGAQTTVLSYDGSGDDIAAAIALGQDGEGLTTVHVAGTSFNSIDNDYVTVKYGTMWPDLTMSAVSGPATGFNGGDIVISNTVLNVNDPNTGNADAGPFDMGLYLAPDAGGSPDLNALIFLGTRAVSHLTTGASSTAGTTVTIPETATVPAGSYFLVAVADMSGTVTEKIETNNTGSSAATIAISDAPDLVANSTSGPATGASGGNITVDYSILNSRAAAAGSFDINFVLSSDTIIGNGDDVALPIVSGGAVGGIAGNDSASGSATVTIPNSVGSGDYYMGLIVDSGGAVAESREDDNTVASVSTVSVTGLPDLTVTAVSGPLGATAGQNITVTNTVHSTGDVGSFDVDLYLSADDVIDDATDTHLGSRTVTGLSAGASSTDNILVTLPGGTAQGIYYVGAIVDLSNAVPEGNDSNNTLSSSITTSNANGSLSGGVVTVGDGSGGDDVDLIVSNVSGPANAIRGTSISVDTTVENVLATAAGTFDVGIYLSPDPDITAADVLLGTRTVTSLAGNSADSASTSVSIPIDLASPDVKGLWHMNALGAPSLPPDTVDNGNGTWTTTLQPDGANGIDTYVQSFGAGGTNTSNTNYGTSASLIFNYYSAYDSEVLLQFDLSSLPIATLNNATLSITTASTTGSVSMTYLVDKILEPWNESTVTWNTKPARSGNNYASATVPINGVANWNITSLAAEWLAGTSANYGMSLYRAGSTGSASNSNWYRNGLSSDFGTASSRPKLTLTYVPVPGVADVSANANNGALLGGIFLGGGKYGSALDFDGTSSRVVIPDNGVGLTSPFTLEAWVKPTVNTGSQVIVAKEGSYLMAVRNGTLQYAITTAGTGGYVNTGLAVPAGTWSHVAVTYDGTTALGYVDGVADSIPDQDPDGGPVDSNGNPICIGNRGAECAGSEYFKGSIDEVTLYSVALDGATILQHSNSSTEGAAWNRAYYLGAIADVDDTVVEVNEANNAAVQAVSGSPGATTVSAVNNVAGGGTSSSEGSGGGSLGWPELVLMLLGLTGFRLMAWAACRRNRY